MGFETLQAPMDIKRGLQESRRDRAVFANCRFEGYQDTLYVQAHKQFYRSCIVSGTIDFIFGDAAVVFRNCIMVVRKPNDNRREHGQDRELPWKAMEGVLKNHCDGIRNR
ncbi:unnamed protein product [Sphenostylis stenocarpa]|uniref:Pectinesterase n=1 Tax=Sphenostylis stenocarpa TaxID=92480 RepID=A0AA86VSS7_9FABA|nr:unnamed protein product [Sphenostylis stenocarpa]